MKENMMSSWNLTVRKLISIYVLTFVLFKIIEAYAPGTNQRNAYAFVALTHASSAYPWGNSSSGGNASEHVSSQLKDDVEKVFSTQTAFAVLKSGGTVITWGNAVNGGD